MIILFVLTIGFFSKNIKFRFILMVKLNLWYLIKLARSKILNGIIFTKKKKRNKIYF